MKSLLRVGLPWDQDQLVARRGFVGASREHQLLHKGLSTCIIYTLHSFSAVNLVQFQLQKGSCLKKYLIFTISMGFF